MLNTTVDSETWSPKGGTVVPLFVSVACFVVFGAIFAATFAIDHFASIWETADPGTWHGRFAIWADNSRRLDIVQGLSGLAAAFSCLAFVVIMYLSLTFVDSGGHRHFALYITGGPGTELGTATREFSATRGELSRMPMFEYLDSQRIVKGRISSILPIGGGLTHVCIANGDFCGLSSASLGLKAGDVAYIRIGRPAGMRRPPAWTVSADEAQSLSKSAQFTVEER
jgi:hypothetical protein